MILRFLGVIWLFPSNRIGIEEKQNEKQPYCGNNTLITQEYSKIHSLWKYLQKLILNMKKMELETNAECSSFIVNCNLQIVLHWELHKLSLQIIESPSCIWVNESDLPPLPIPPPPDYQPPTLVLNMKLLRKGFPFDPFRLAVSQCEKCHIEKTFRILILFVCELELGWNLLEGGHTQCIGIRAFQSQTGQNTVMRLQRYFWVLCLLAPLNVWFERQMEKQMLAYLAVTYTGT